MTPAARPYYYPPVSGRPGFGALRISADTAKPYCTLTRIVRGAIAIVRATINLCWRLFSWGLAAALVVLVVVGGYLYFKLDEEITRYAQGFLSQHYQHLEVQIEAASYVPGTGVVVRGLSLAQPQSGAEPKPLLRVAELRMLGAIDTESLRTRRPRIDRIEAVRPELLATRLTDGTWDVQQLLPPPDGGGGPPPPLHVHRATLTLRDASKPGAPPFVLRNLDLHVLQKPPEAADRRSRIELRGRAEDSLAKLLQFEGQVDADGGRLDMRVRVEQLAVTTDRLLTVPGLSPLLLMGMQLDGRVDATGAVSRATPISPLNWKCDFGLTQGSLTHPLVPRPMTDVQLSGECDPTGIRIRQAHAKSGEAELTAALNAMGWGPEARAACSLQVRRLTLGPELRGALPSKLQGAWARFDPRGEVDVRASLRMTRGRVWSDVTVDGRDLSFEDNKKFAYRVQSATGQLRFIDTKRREESRLVLSLDGQAEGRAVHLEGEFRGLPLPPEQKGECPPGYLRVTGNNLRLTDRLLAALPPSAQKPLEMLDADAQFAVTWQLQRDSLQQEKPTHSMDLLVHDGSLRFKGFPYPVRRVSGRVQQRGQQWTFSEFSSRSETGSKAFHAAGSFDAGAARPRLVLQINGAGVPLDDTLRAAFPASIQAAWATLRPTGQVNFESQIAYSPGDAKPQIDVTVRPVGGTVSLMPQFFPYRLEQVRGEFTATGDEIRFLDARAQHGVTRLRTDGEFLSQGDGGWNFVLQNLSVDRLNESGDFRAAAPLELRQIINRLSPRGGLGLHHGNLTFTRVADPRAPLRVAWDVQLDCQQLDINAGVPIEDLFGTVRLKGHSTGEDGVSYGELALESLLWNGYQLTDISGPLYCDKTQCLVGRGAAYKMGAQQRPAMAQAYGGVAAVDARAVFDTRPSYGLDVSLTGVDLGRLNEDYLHKPAELKGKLEGRVQVQGAGNSVYGMTGSGELKVRDAELYELPLLVSMLKVLRNRTPDSTAFNQIDAKFTLQGEHLTFQQLDLLGDAISLYGRGDASLDRQVNLVFHTMVGRNNLVAPVLKTLAGQASEQLLKLKVTGPVDDAEVTREALPLVSNVLGQLQQDLRPAPLTRPAQIPNAAAQRR